MISRLPLTVMEAAVLVATSYPCKVSGPAVARTLAAPSFRYRLPVKFSIFVAGASRIFSPLADLM